MKVFCVEVENDVRFAQRATITEIYMFCVFQWRPSWIFEICHRSAMLGFLHVRLVYLGPNYRRFSSTGDGYGDKGYFLFSSIFRHQGDERFFLVSDLKALSLGAEIMSVLPYGRRLPRYRRFVFFYGGHLGFVIFSQMSNFNLSAWKASPLESKLSSVLLYGRQLQRYRRFNYQNYVSRWQPSWFSAHV